MLCAVLLLSQAVHAALFNSASVDISTGKKVKMTGSGPPVVFSGGLYGVTTWRMYDSILSRLCQNFTMALVPGICRSEDVTAFADAVGVDRVGFLSHSSFDASILQNSNVQAAILNDPITIPGMPSVYTQVPTCVLRSGLLFHGNRLPEFNRLTIHGDVTDLTFHDAGHTDMLDDMWASMAEKTDFWDTIQPIPQSFSDWSFAEKKKSVSGTREKYRCWIVERTNSFLLRSNDISWR